MIEGYFEATRDRILAALVEADVHSKRAEQLTMLAHRVFCTVFDKLPSVIDSRVPLADAQIYTRQQLRHLLVEFALDLLSLQTGALIGAVAKKASRRT